MSEPIEYRTPETVLAIEDAAALVTGNDGDWTRRLVRDVTARLNREGAHDYGTGDEFPDADHVTPEYLWEVCVEAFDEIGGDPGDADHFGNAVLRTLQVDR